MVEKSTALIIDGKAVSAKVREQVACDVKDFVSTFGRAPGLHVVLVGDDPASRVYVRNKEKAAAQVGIRGVTHALPSTTTEAELHALIDKLNADPEVDGILIQLPLPQGLTEQSATDRIDPRKDVDGLHPWNAGLLASSRPAIASCTPLGCIRLLDEIGVELKGLHAVVIGRSNLVGKPLAQLLLSRHATVTIAHSRTRELATICRQADVLVAAVGKAKLIQGDWIKPGAVVIDVGTNTGPDGKLVGDVDFEAALGRVKAITPVPGGVGPMTIACLLSNTVQAARLRLSALST